MDGVDQLFVAFVKLLQFAYDWTLGLLVRAASMDPTGMNVIQLVLWIIVLISVLGVVVWLIYILFNSLFIFFRGPQFYRHPYFFFPVGAWICAFLLLYVLR